LLTLTFQDITHPDDLDPDLGNVRRLLAGEISHYHMEKRYIHKDGRIVWVSLTVSLVRHADGTPAYFVSQIQDITQRRAAHEQIQASLAEKEVLLKEIHHRVKNNLQVISSLLRIQSGYLKDPADTEILRECETRIQTMAMVHERLYQSGNFAEIDFGGHLRELAALVVRAQSRDPERFRLDVQCASALVSLDDAIPLGLIAAELMINAFKHAFSDRTYGCVRVRFQREAEGLILEVADDGVGLPADFNFEQGKTLGLRLIRSLARQLRAEVSAESAPGATIRVRVP
jgi:two-component sensor histidine kinase